MKRYNSQIKESRESPKEFKFKLKEDKQSDDAANQAIEVILEANKFYVNTFKQACALYYQGVKLCGKKPIEPWKFRSDIDKHDMLNLNKWIETFWNSVMIAFFDVPELRDLGHRAFDNEDLKYKIMKIINDKNPRNLQTLIKAVQGL